ncbi:flagellin [Arvimicrobium flavum]|uniref:flagellin N-terminal helical domain-containing protein n=1 Tax=Arvimicrobium flavum TaxID=3393320 RepID=UPI00237B129B|nr:flagellin [Mesorhizobium shangrilense]
MTSIMTNASAMTALQSLSATNRSLETTQGRISTGFRVSEAADNAAYWSIATTMRSDNKALSTVQDALGLGASKVDTAYTAMNRAVEIANEIKVKIVAAVGQSEDNKSKIQTEIETLKTQLKSYADGATFSGTNWLAVNSTVANGHAAAGTHNDAQIISSFNRDNDGNVVLTTIKIGVQDVKLFDAAATTNETKGILEGIRDTTTGARTDGHTQAVAGTVAATTGYSIATLDVVGFSDQQIQQMLVVVDKTLAEMTDAATKLGAAKKSVDLQKTFVSQLMDSIDRGVGQLVDADMSKESTRLQALQVQQQLGIQALSIANGNAQNILALFKG